MTVWGLLSNKTCLPTHLSTQTFVLVPLDYWIKSDLCHLELKILQFYFWSLHSGCPPFRTGVVPNSSADSPPHSFLHSSSQCSSLLICIFHASRSNPSPICSGKPHSEILLSLILGFPIMTLKFETCGEFIPEAVKRRHKESLLFTPATTRAVLLLFCLIHRDSASKEYHILHFAST